MRNASSVPFLVTSQLAPGHSSSTELNNLGSAATSTMDESISSTPTDLSQSVNTATENTDKAVYSERVVFFINSPHVPPIQTITFNHPLVFQATIMKSKPTGPWKAFTVKLQYIVPKITQIYLPRQKNPVLGFEPLQIMPITKTSVLTTVWFNWTHPCSSPMDAATPQIKKCFDSNNETASVKVLHGSAKIVFWNSFTVHSAHFPCNPSYRLLLSQCCFVKPVGVAKRQKYFENNY